MATTKKEPTLYDPHFWGLSTRPREPEPAPAPAPKKPKGPRRPFEAGAYQGSPFGPFPSSPSDLGKDSPILRITDPPQELRYNGEWRTISRHDLPDDLSFGRVVVQAATVSGQWADTIDGQPIVEVRIFQQTAGIAELVIEAATGQRQDQTSATSPGPVCMVWEHGKVPDGYEVQARARRGGYADGPQEGDDAETLQVTVTGRFHR